MNGGRRGLCFGGRWPETDSRVGSCTAFRRPKAGGGISKIGLPGAGDGFSGGLKRL